MSKFLLIGRPGCGKGSLARPLSEYLKIPTISSGELVRAEIKQNTEIGRLCKQASESGQLVPDTVIIPLILARLSQTDCRNGFILDGFPRTVAQARLLEQKHQFDHVIWLDIDKQVCLQRIAGRRINSYGVSYNIYFDPPPEGMTVHQRADDREEIVLERFTDYASHTTPLLAHYKNGAIIGQTNLIRVANLTTDQNLQQILRALGSENNNHRQLRSFM